MGADNLTRFASLTATLLARKGEAVPAAESVEQMSVPHKVDMRRLGLSREQRERMDTFLNEDQIDLEDSTDGGQRRNQVVDRNGPMFGPGSQRHLSRESAPVRPEVPSGLATQHVRSEEPVVPQGAASASLVVPSGLWPAGRVLKKRTAVTLRLDEKSYLRLKYAGARLHRTNQDILSAALDSYLENLGPEYFEACQWVHDYKEN